MKYYKTIEKHVEWLAEQIDNLEKAVSVAEYHDKDFGEIEWPISTFRVLERDIQETFLYVAKPFAHVEAACGLIDLEKKFAVSKKDIDYFFIKMHLLGHKIMVQVKPNLDIEDLSDVAFSEVTNLFFAMLACHKYYGLTKITPYMAKELAGGLYDLIKIEKSEGEKYSGVDYINTCREMIKILYDNDVKWLH